MAESTPPPLKVTPITYGVQGKGKEKVIPGASPPIDQAASSPPPSQTLSQPSQGASPTVRAPVSTFNAEVVLARARRLLQGFRSPAFGSGSTASASGEAIEAAKKTLTEGLQQSLGEALAHQSAITSALSTLLSGGVSSVDGLELSRLGDLDRVFTGFAMAKDDLAETRGYFTKTDDLKSKLSSALDSAGQVEAMHNRSQENLAKAEAAVEEMKALLKEAIENRRRYRQEAEEHANIFTDASVQVDELAKEFADLESKKFTMQTRHSEAEIRFQKAETEWNGLRAALRPVGPATPAPTVSPSAADAPSLPSLETASARPIPSSITEESAEDEVSRLFQEAEQRDPASVVAPLGSEFSLPVLETVENEEAAQPDT